MPTIRVLLLLPLCATVATAQQNGRAEAKAEAHAHASARGGESSTSTHRVVVENGKVVVDERTTNGKPAGGAGAGAGRPGPMPPLPLPGDVPSADELLRQLQEQVRRDADAEGGTAPTRPVPGAKPVVPVPGARPAPPAARPPHPARPGTGARRA
ncbi:MAG: hypothetical protein JNK15_10710 [Planctomycetes bacterium]|nr:hypothetical protein [Planctomycetota bacterium]